MNDRLKRCLLLENALLASGCVTVCWRGALFEALGDTGSQAVAGPLMTWPERVEEALKLREELQEELPHLSWQTVEALEGLVMQTIWTALQLARSGDKVPVTKTLYAEVLRAYSGTDHSGLYQIATQVKLNGVPHPLTEKPFSWETDVVFAARSIEIDLERSEKNPAYVPDAYGYPDGVLMRERVAMRENKQAV